jgi:DNA-binding NarL/FixJ family response regulator
VVGESADTTVALDDINSLHPDVVLLDVGMSDGPPLARKIRDSEANTRVVAIAVSSSSADVIHWAEAGISGYITRDQTILDLVATVERAARGEIVCPSGVVASLLQGLALEFHSAPSPKDQLQKLTPREAEIVTLIDAGLSNKEIARALSIALPTVKNHVHSVLRKLEAPHRFDAARRLRSQTSRAY